MKLFEISREYEEILNDLYDDEGNINQEALVRLESNEHAMEKKAIAIASFIQNINAEREAIEKAKKAMIEREKHCEKIINEMKEKLLFGMQRRSITHVKCPYFEIKLKKCPLSVDDDRLNMDLLPDEYKNTKIEIKANKNKILQEMKMGVIIPGVSLKQNVKLDIR